jgi:antagonist of KipI
MSLLVLEKGILTTVQDLGRNGFRHFGITPGGAMDSFAVRLINILLGNEENEPVFEIHFPAPVFEFEQDTLFALGGADFSAYLNEVKLENWRAIRAKAGSRLNFLQRISGARCYLAVRGGFQTEKWLGSASANLTVGFGKNLQKGDRIFFKNPESPPATFSSEKSASLETDVSYQTFANAKNSHSSKTFGNFQSPEDFKTTDSLRFKISHRLIPRYSHFPTVRVIPGAEFEKLTAISVENFLKKSFKVSHLSDRMGFRLEGEPLYLIDESERSFKASMVSSAVNFGTIQLLADGQMVILMADHQTSGGYPRIAHVVEVDLPLVAQLNPNDKLYFEMISEEEAEQLLLMRERDLKFFKWAVKLWRW